MNRRQLIKGIGAAICAGLTPGFVPGLIDSNAAYLFDSEGNHIKSSPCEISWASGSEVRVKKIPQRSLDWLATQLLKSDRAPTIGVACARSK